MATSEEDKKNKVPSWELAKEGIKLLINNKQQEAEALFNSYPENLHLSAGYAYAIVTDALMTFEDDKIHIAFQVLRDLEKKCSSYNGWISSVKSKVFGSGTNCSYAEKLESQIILADVLVFDATLNFLQQDISGYFKGGWTLRKSYRQYQSLYSEILGLYNKIVGDDNVPGEFLNLSSTSSVKSVHSTPSLESPTLHTSSSSIESNKPEVQAKPECSTTQIIHLEEKDSLMVQELITTMNLVEQPSLNTPYEKATEDKAIPENTETLNPSSELTNENNSQLNHLVAEEAKLNEDLNVNDEETNNGTENSKINNPKINHDLSIPSSSIPQNGYILPPNSPKHSISCHANLNMCSVKFKQCNHNSSIDCKFCRSSTRNADDQNLSRLKKSTSVNNSLSSQVNYQRRSFSFADNMSIFTSSFNIFSPSTISTRELDKNTVGRLLCAVSFGYGLLQLGISLLPPSVLKLTSFLGFGGNRKNGLEKLMYARTGSDMRAPFATLALLWYHTIVRPFFALDGNNVHAGVTTAARLIDETKDEFGESALFLFFKGRVERLSSNIPAAIVAFKASIENASQREVKMISMHEVGWCYLIALDYTQSENMFLRLMQSSRWSRSFYAYLAMISAGSSNMFQEVKDACELRNIFQSVPKGTQLDEFLNRRYSISSTAENVLRQTSSLFWKVLVYELLYLWNALPSCTKTNILKIIEDCKATSETNAEPMKGLSKLIEGSCYCILKNFEAGVSCFRHSIEIRNGLPYNSDTAHVSAFARYELGLLLITKEKLKLEGKKILQSIAYYKSYDFEQRLSVRVHAILKNL